VYAFFPEYGLVSYDRAGTKRWSHELGSFRSFYGMAGSPILSEDSFILVCDQARDSFILSLDKTTGRQRWRKDRPGRIDSWTAPLLNRPESGPAQIIVQGTFYVDPYNAGTGGKLWESASVGYTPVGSPVIRNHVAYASTPNHAEQPMPSFQSMATEHDTNKDGRLSSQEMAKTELGAHFGWIDRDENGYVESKEYESILQDVAGANYGLVAMDLKEKGSPTILWRHKKGLPYIATPLLYQDVLYLLKDGGILTTLDPATGEVHKEGRLAGALGNYFASPVAADSKIFLCSFEGKVSVLKAAAQWEILQVSDLGEEVYATPAISKGTIYIRTKGGLYCFGNPFK